MKLGLRVENHWRFECVGAEGRVKWVEEFDNLVCTGGMNDLLEKYFKGSGYTAAWYVGLTDASPTFAAGDTMASHAGWTENQNYTQGTRPPLSLGSASGGSIDNAASKAQFTINAATTVGGGFIATNGTKGGTTGTLYGGAAFTAGSRSVLNGDTLNVQVTLTVS
jgi:hypothetical protein